MLSDEIIEKAISKITRRIELGNTYVLEQIGKSIKKVGALSPSSAHRLGQLIKYGGDYDKIVKKLAEITNLNVKDIKILVEEVAKSDYQFAKQFYDYRNKKYIPYDENIVLKNQVEAISTMTAQNYVNLSNTVAFNKNINGKLVATPLAQAYQKTLDTAILSISEGKVSFQETTRKLIKELADSGIRTVDYVSGRSVRLDSAIRMQIRDALRNLHNQQQEIIGKEFDADGVEISVHLNPAPDHAEVQGKQFSNEEFAKFQNDIDCKSYDGKIFPAEFEGHDRRSISQYNCYHYIFSIVLGVSKPEYTNAELQDIIDKNNEGFEFDGKHYTNYEGTQLQRQLETEIRKQKDIQIMAKASGDNLLALDTQRNIKMLSDKYKKLGQVSGLPSMLDRASVSNYRQIITSPRYMNIKIEKDRKLYNKIVKEKQIYHSTDSLKQLLESETADINLQVLNKNKKPLNYGQEGIYLKPEALDYSVRLYNGDRGNQFTGQRQELLREKNIYNFIDKAGEEHLYSTSIVRKMPIIENVLSIVTYKNSPNYDYFVRLAKKYNINLITKNK